MPERDSKIGGLNLEIHFEDREPAGDATYILAGYFQGENLARVSDGGSLLIEIAGTGKVEEAFIDEQGHFEHVLELDGGDSHRLELTVCSISGKEIGHLGFAIGQPTSEPAAKGELSSEITLQPEWNEFAKLVRHCLILAGEVADQTGRNREELFEQVYAQERYAEQAYAARNVRYYQECVENLKDFLSYLERLRPAGQRRPPTVDDVRREVPNMRQEIAALISLCRSRSRSDREEELSRLEKTLDGLPDRAKKNVNEAVGEIQRFYARLDGIHRELTAGEP